MSDLVVQDGVLKFPVPLQLQCLLYTVGHLNEIPINRLSLLPRSIRIQLLLLLPVIDVCKLENTPVTNDIDMDNEIWEILYKQRLFTRYWADRYNLVIFISPFVKANKFGIELTWKEGYFQAVLSWLFRFGDTLMDVATNCLCNGSHYLFDTLYSTYSLFPLPSDEELYDDGLIHIEDIVTPTVNSFHGLIRSANGPCACFTPFYYNSLCNGRVLREVSLKDFVKQVKDSFVLRMYDQKEIRNYESNNGGSLPQEIKEFFGSVEAVKLFCTSPFDLLSDFILNDSIRVSNIPRIIIDGLIYQDRMNRLFNALKGDMSSLSEHSVSLLSQDTKDLLPEMIWCEVYFAKFGDQLLSVCLERSTIETSHLTDLLLKQTKLECFTIRKCSLVIDTLPPFIMKLFEMKSLKELQISFCCMSAPFQRELLQCFLQSPYSIVLNLQEVYLDSREGERDIIECVYVADMADKDSFEVKGKCLKIKDCSMLLEYNHIFQI